MWDPIPKSHEGSFHEMLNALVLQMRQVSLDPDELQDFCTHCHDELDRLGRKHREIADPPRGHARPGLAQSSRHHNVADQCDNHAMPTATEKERLLTQARDALERARSEKGEARAFGIAEMRLSLMLGEHEISDLGLDDGALRDLLESVEELADAA